MVGQRPEIFAVLRGVRNRDYNYIASAPAGSAAVGNVRHGRNGRLQVKAHKGGVYPLVRLAVYVDRYKAAVLLLQGVLFAFDCFL